jgi:thioesterase domain-containing protein
VEVLAQKYIEKIKKVQPHGPYYIAGWSAGGIISFEIVKQLEQENEEIAFLGVIDAPAPRTGDWETTGEFNLESERAVIMDYLPDHQLYEKLKNVTELRQIWPIVTGYLETDNPHVETLKKTIARYSMEALPNYRQLETSETIHYLNIGRTVHNMLALYSPQGKIHTPIHFFAAARSEWGTAEPWNDYCQRVIDAYEIPCDHYAVFKMPQVDEFAKRFDRILNGLLIGNEN